MSMPEWEARDWRGYVLLSLGAALAVIAVLAVVLWLFGGPWLAVLLGGCSGYLVSWAINTARLYWDDVKDLRREAKLA